MMNGTFKDYLSTKKNEISEKNGDLVISIP